MDKVVITSAVRTPVGSYLGGFKTVPSEVLGAEVLKEAIRRSDISSDLVDQVILGEVVGSTPDVARAAALLAGFPEKTPGYTIDRQCGSALQAVISGSQEILAGDARVIVAGGTENMSRSPYYLPFSVRYEGFRMGAKSVLDAFAYASEFPYAPVNGQAPEKLNMGLTAENVAALYNITRERQDEFALDSQRKTAAAVAAGKFKEEILPIKVVDRKKEFIVDADEHPKPDTTLENLAKLRPAFKEGGSVTAGNASGMNDGASAVVLMLESTAQELNRKPLVRILANATTGVDPRVMGLGPAKAIPQALAKVGLTLEEIDLFEINEAFAAQALGCLIELGMEPGTELYERVNVNGGAIAHGHPLGNSGSRILTTLIYELKRRNGRYGVASLCIGGGQGIALVVENIN
ncbi:acetyl-CoA acetyltransferase [Clostridia bacterium]|nr:acetyl-CoA acetyltransferase [Clostridia bacterium]